MSNSDFLNTVANVDVPDYSNGGYDGPPRMWWHNGKKDAKTPGTFYTKAQELSEVPGAPWEAVRKFEDEDGYQTSKLKIAVIGYRQQAFRDDGDRRVWLAEWSEGARLYTEVLCFVQGIEQAPVVWCCKGLTGKAVTNKNGSILGPYRAGLLAEAEKRAGKRLPLWTFWLPIRTQGGEQVVYSDTGHRNAVTLPELHPKVSQDLETALNGLFVGSELYVRGAEIRAEYDAWLKQRRGGVEDVAEAGDEYESVGAQPQAERPARRAAVMDEAELPF